MNSETTTRPISLTEIFLVFFRIASLTFGGGLALIAMMRSEFVTKRRWISDADMLDAMSLAQSMPGVFAVNASIHIGVKLRGWRGMIVGVLATTLPSFLIIICLAGFLSEIRDAAAVKSVFSGIRAGMAALLVSIVYDACKQIIQGWESAVLALAAAIALVADLSPPVVLALCGISGWCFLKDKK